MNVTNNFIFGWFNAERKNPIKDQVPSVVKEMFTKLMDSYPEFSGCGGTVAAFVMLTRKSDAQDVRPQFFVVGFVLIRHVTFKLFLVAI